jgi:uncharacterized protein (TIGR02611 family)
MVNDPPMIERLKGHWEEFRKSRPGERFKKRYRRRQERPGHIVTRIVLIILGTILAVGSLFTAPLPGPGFATVFLGLAILAGELLPAARFLDWSEVRLRKLWRFIQNVWRSGMPGKVSVVVVTATLAGAFFYVVYLVLFARGRRTISCVVKMRSVRGRVCKPASAWGWEIGVWVSADVHLARPWRAVLGRDQPST